jgi:hypothetical protein
VEPPVGGGMGAAGRCIICSHHWHRESKDRHGRVPLMCEEHAKMLQVRHPLALPSLFLSIIVHQIGLALIEQ